MFSLKAGSAFGSATLASLSMYGFVKGQTDQSEEALEGIQIMFNVVPAAFFFGGCVDAGLQNR